MIVFNAKFMFLFAHDESGVYNVSRNLDERAHKTINMKYPRSISCVVIVVIVIVIVWPNIE